MSTIPQPDVIALHRSALDATGEVVSRIRTEQWANSTTCPEWNVHDLLNHVVAGNLWAERLAHGATITEVGTELDGDQLGTAPSDAYDDSAARSAAAFEAPGALDAPCAVSYGPVPGSVYAGHRFLDVFIHGWDLAVATGQDITLAPDLVEGCWQVLTPQLEMLRASAMFGDDLTDGETDPERRLLMTLGRTP